VKNQTATESTLQAAAPAAAEYSEIAALAYELWEDRGCPIGSPEQDWFRAEQEIHDRSVAAAAV